MSEPPRPSSRPSPPATLLGDGGDYYVPGQAWREPEVIMATWFLLATETEAPEVRESLYTEVYPLLPAGAAYFPAFRNQDHKYDFFADEWNLPEWAKAPDDDPADLKAHPMVPCLLALRTWARRFGFTSHWVIEAAIAVLTGWTYEETGEEFGQGTMPDGWGEAIDFWANGWEPLSDEEREYMRKTFRTSPQIPRLEPFEAEIHDHWEPRFETRQEFVTRMHDHLTRRLDRYFAAVEPQLEEHGFEKVPRKTARHHLTWLVQQRICGMSCEAIAERYAKENPRLESPPSAGAVAKAIRRTAEMIELD